MEEEGTIRAVEIKSGQTYNSRMESGLKNWHKLTGNDPVNNFLVYAGEQEGELEPGHLLPWRRGLDIL